MKKTNKELAEEIWEVIRSRAHEYADHIELVMYEHTGEEIVVAIEAVLEK